VGDYGCEERLRRDTMVGIMMREKKWALGDKAYPQSRGREEGRRGRAC
jgi:hypothetical protein